MDILKRFSFCPVCGSPHFAVATAKSLRCAGCGFEYFVNASGAYVALIVNDRKELLVVRRRNEPAKGTLDLPGGFADMDETAEEGVAREVMEETGLTVTRSHYLLSRPNRYEYGGISIPTLDLFFSCQVSDLAPLHAADDAAEVMWVPLAEVDPEQFGLHSIREGLYSILKHLR